ncbi:MAG TPA: hypothetical protein VFP50_15280 [Anaeromyxobacteraceae bacterium]|nr:hypothetical protein [Anaeromyxobacteraceae bacterium]
MANGAAQVKLEAERKIGAVLEEQRRRGTRAQPADNLRRGPKRHDDASKAQAVAKPPTLEELGIEPNAARRYQAVARAPEEKFREYIRAQKEHPDGEITTAGFLRVAMSRNPHAASNVSSDPEKNERFTPVELVSALHREFRFTVDVCGHPLAPASKLIGKFYTKEDDARTKDLTGERPFFNVPFDELEFWVKFTHELVASGKVKRAVHVMPASRTEQPLWQRWIEPYRLDRNGSGVRARFLHGGSYTGNLEEDGSRTRYGNPDDPEGLDVGSPGWASVIVIWEGPLRRSPEMPLPADEQATSGAELPAARRALLDAAGKAVDAATPEARAALARVGINALVDEATGYQESRPAGALREMLTGEADDPLPFLQESLAAYRSGDDVCPGCGRADKEVRASKAGWRHRGGHLSICGRCNRAGKKPAEVSKSDEAAWKAAKDEAQKKPARKARGRR